METSGLLPQQGRILSGWKEIAAYLGRGIRTVQRYERDFALPIHRPAGGKSGGAVVATGAEIDAWVRIREISDCDAGLSYDSLRCEIRRFRENRMQLRELRAGLRESIAMLRASIEKVSLSRSSFRPPDLTIDFFSEQRGHFPD